MIRRYCDACGTEIDKSAVNDRIKVKRTVRPNRDEPWQQVTIEVEVTVGTTKAVNGAVTWNSGDLCVGCVLDTVAIADGRPQPEDQP